MKHPIITAVAFAAAVGFPNVAFAQFGGSVVTVPPSVTTTQPGSVTSDQPVEAATQDIDTVQLPPIVASLTTSTNGTYTPNTSFISSLDTAMFSGINPQNASTILPVTQGLPCDSYTPMVTQTAPTLQTTYVAALTNTQQLMTELQNENFSTNSANVLAPAELGSTQAGGQVGLEIVKQLQLLRVQMAQLTLVIATDRLHELDTAVRPRMIRTGGGC